MAKTTKIKEKRGKMNTIKKLSLSAIGFVIVLFTVILLSSNVSAAVLVNPNASSEKNATVCINDSYQIMQNLEIEGFTIKRINDTIKQEEQIFASQTLLKSKGRYYDFSGVLTLCNEIDSLYKDALKAKDQLSSLLKFYQESISPGMNTSSIDLIINDIQSEMKDERYEKVSPLIDRAYSEIINVQASFSSVNLFYQSTAKGFGAFLLRPNLIFQFIPPEYVQIRNWHVIIGFFVIFIFAYGIYRIKIHIWMINKKMAKLQIRKKTVKELLMKTQKDYFQYGKISEGDYNIKVKKFAELVRDIDRQIPLLQEELAKLQRVKSKK